MNENESATRPVCAMQFSNFLKQLFRLVRCELNRADVVDAVTMFVGFVVSEVRLYNVRAE